MKRLLDDFAKLFDLDYRVRGVRLGDLIQRAIDDLDERPLPDWGIAGDSNRYETERGRTLDFHYLPHLFPDMELNLRLAHKLQFYMLPRVVPSQAPLSIAAVLESFCHLSGDLFGWEMLADGRFLIWIVDLAGHGVPSGLSSAVLKVLIDNLRRRGRVGSLVTELNEIFLGCIRDDRSSLFATGFFMAVAPDGAACFTSAGHPPALLRRRDGTIEHLASNGLPAGMFTGHDYVAEVFRLEEDDLLLMYSDGLVETANPEGEPFGVERLSRLLEAQAGSPGDLTRSIYRAVSSFQDMDKLEDDVTFVAARMHAAS